MDDGDRNPPRVLVVQNTPTSGLGRLGDWLAFEGLRIELMAGSALPASLAGYHGLVLLGGGFMPDDDASLSWLPHERTLTGEALDAEVPVLGICLGHQVLAHVVGGEVTAESGETERGSVGVRLTEAAAQDPLFSSFAGQELRMIQNHRDSVTALPPHTVLLGTNDTCRVQAFRAGVRAWGIQFHPEVAPEGLYAWDEASLAKEGVDRAELAAAAARDAETNREQGRTLARAFATVVKEYAATEGGAG